MRENVLKRRLKAGGPVVGVFNDVHAPSVVEVSGPAWPGLRHHGRGALRAHAGRCGEPIQGRRASGAFDGHSHRRELAPGDPEVHRRRFAGRAQFRWSTPPSRAERVVDAVKYPPHRQTRPGGASRRRLRPRASPPRTTSARRQRTDAGRAPDRDYGGCRELRGDRLRWSTSMCCSSGRPTCRHRSATRARRAILKCWSLIERLYGPDSREWASPPARSPATWTTTRTGASAACSGWRPARTGCWRAGCSGFLDDIRGFEESRRVRASDAATGNRGASG